MNDPLLFLRVSAAEGEAPCLDKVWGVDSALDRREWPASRFGRFTTSERSPDACD
jgi:hypothetical protein